MDKMRQTQTDADLRHDRRASHDAARNALTYPNCGTEDGLLGWSPEGVKAAIEEAKYPLPEFYIAAGYDPSRLYTRCLVCQAAGAEVLARCTQLTATQLAAWVLPEGYPVFHNLTVTYLTEQIKAQWRRQ